LGVRFRTERREQKGIGGHTCSGSSPAKAPEEDLTKGVRFALSSPEGESGAEGKTGVGSVRADLWAGTGSQKFFFIGHFFREYGGELYLCIKKKKITELQRGSLTGHTHGLGGI
jgi:hypothetical protein